ncbi:MULTISPECIES: hypothetical protein [Myroides]|uniref:Uncharacterized protein n=1 Tax=Myroides albus TaxID=2562892 RepID=A0A6I3LHM5_9FLAO|nr:MULTISPECIES: hypothetical protein [Myroides]MTG98008.1 hypothetical protein [Myroides albus]MVX34843.1 hypothetical protein [Myroides sp. LoEW2-1]UVD80300.1 hypothetical protein NWE55_03175 [Myroides albus]
MALQNLPLYNFANGTLMIIIFALVCVGLVIALFMFMGGSPKLPDTEDEQEKQQVPPQVTQDNMEKTEDQQ